MEISRLHNYAQNIKNTIITVISQQNNQIQNLESENIIVYSRDGL